MDFRHLRRPIHLILDWDGTLTRKDTLALVGQIAYTHSKTPSSLPPWSEFANGWMNDFSEHSARYEPKTAARTTLDQERQWLASLSTVENCSVHRVEASGIFRGVTHEDVDSVAKNALASGELQLRSHWDTLLQKVLKHDASTSATPNLISILSVNWSERFIRQSLLRAAETSTSGSEGERSALTTNLQTMEICANEISGIDNEGGSDGTLNRKGSKGVRTSADKLAILSKWASKNEGFTTVYMGDSATDLEALLAADVGICIRDEPMGSSQRELAETLERIGVDVVPVEQSAVYEGTSKKVVYWASEYEQIIRALEV